MERIELLVRAHIVSEAPGSELDQIVSDITTGKGTLLHVVKALGDYLTTEEESIRSKGVDLLSSVLSQCPDQKITKQSAHVLTIFYCDKLEDSDTLIPALKGLESLTSKSAFSSEDGVIVSKALFQYVTMKALIQSVRFTVFLIIDNLISRHRGALKNMGDEFLNGYIELAEGEKDPRNLLLAFSIDRVLVIEFNISNVVEALFDITFCYFPISFRPPPGDTSGIGPDDLKKSLRSCLSATPFFGPLAMPLFLEKLSAGSGATKRDTMQTVAACLPVYGVSLSRSFASKLWSALKLEIFQPIDTETSDCALQTTQTLIQVIYPIGETDSSKDAPEGLGKQIVEECLEFLKEPEKSKAKPAIKVMAALVHTTPFITRYTLSQTVPHLINLFRDPAEISNRPATLTALETLLRAVESLYKETKEKQTARSYDAERPLDPFKDEIMAVFTVGLKSPSSTPPALGGLDAIIKIQDFLTDEELGFVVHSINEVLSPSAESTDEVRAQALKVLSVVSLFAPIHVESTTLPLLFSSLPDAAPSRDALTETAQYRRILANLTFLCTSPPLFETLVIRLSTKLDLISAAPASDPETNAAYGHSILLSLSKVLATKMNDGHKDVPKYLDRLVPHLYEMFIGASVWNEIGEGIANHPKVVHIASKVVQQIVQTAPVERQQTFVNSLYKAFFEGQVSTLVDDHQGRFAGASFHPFDSNASSLQKTVVPLFATPMIGFRKEIRLPVADEAAFLSNIISWILGRAETTAEVVPVIHAVSSIINKHTEALAGYLTEQQTGFWQQNIADLDAPLVRRKGAIQLWTWMTKALVVRNHEIGNAYVDQLFSLFTDESVNWDAAKAIGEIGSGGEDVLTKKNFAVTKILSTQKFFNSVLPRIVEGVESNQSQPSQQTPYLVALASLIKSIPQTVYAPVMPKLMPFLLRGLDLPDLSMRADVIETLSSAAEDKTSSSEAIKAAVSEHAPSLITAMIKNGQLQEVSSSRLRRVAFRCLGLLPGIVRYDILHPYKANVVRELGMCLDDPKRDVRKEAVDARAIWFSFTG
ncbi:hypothetical protein M422DRAFT_23773 [Sphaerobolus stellatus SS14]|nr:hypothetical protein M422DRAFT_23773 [Sphaerobolus stellatus SS14]